MVRLKIAFITVTLLLLAAVIVQNTEPVETRLLFVSVTMPRAALLASTGAAGFVVGMLVALRLRRNE